MNVYQAGLENESDAMIYIPKKCTILIGDSAFLVGISKVVIAL